MLRSITVRHWRDALIRLSPLAILLGVFFLPQIGFTDDYPSRPIALIVPFPPGGVADILVRPLTEKLNQSLGQPVVVENKGGATGTLGAGFVAHANPDGYTLLVGTSNEIVMSPAVFKELPYDPTKAFAPVTPFAEFPNVLVVGPDVPAKSLADIIALARAKPNALTFASAGIGSTNHFTTEIFQREANVQVQHVPYRGGGPAVADVLAGHVTALFATMPSALALIKAGKLRALAVTGEHRSETLPDVPTGKESGLPGLVVTTWNSVMGPAGLPQPIVKRLHDALAAAVADPAIKKTYAELGAEIEISTPQEFSERIRTDFGRWSKIAKEAGISIDQ